MAQNRIDNFKVIVIGGSAGSLDVLLDITSLLPSMLKAVIIIVLHRRSDSESILEKLLSYKTQISVSEVEDKEPIRPGHIYIAPGDYHLLIENENTFSLDYSEKVSYSRPSIDVTFESAAQTFKERLLAVLLSGANADGTEGLGVVKEYGGYSIVQNPETAEVGFMPRQAINAGFADSILDGKEIAVKISELLRQ